MFQKSLLAALFAFCFCSNAFAAPNRYIVHYECNADRNELIVRTLVSQKSAAEQSLDDLSFEWLMRMGRPLECPFAAGDKLYLKTRYQDDGRITIYVNRAMIDEDMGFDPDRVETFKITGDDNHDITVKHTNHYWKEANP